MTPEEIARIIPDHLHKAMDDARRQALQSDIRVLATRIRNEAPQQSPDFNAGISWAVLWLENTATRLTEQSGTRP